MLPSNLRSFIWNFLKPYKRAVAIYVCLALLAGLWGPFNSILIKHIINSLSSSHSENIALLTWPAILLVLNFIVFDNFTWRSISYLNYKYQATIKNKIISETFQFILKHSQQFFHDNLSGKLANQITTLADNIERILHNISANFIRGFSLLMVAFVGMYYVNPSFFYILAVWFIAFASFSIIMSTKLVNLSDIHAESESVISGQLVDSITNISNIRIFARSLYEIFRLEKSLSFTKQTFQSISIFC